MAAGNEEQEGEEGGPEGGQEGEEGSEESRQGGGTAAKLASPKVVPEPAKRRGEAGQGGREEAREGRGEDARRNRQGTGEGRGGSKPAKGRAVPRPAKRAVAKAGEEGGQEAGRAADAGAARHRRRAQQPESLRLRSAGPSFTVSDIEKSLVFYRDVLGFTLKERWEQDGALHGVELVAGKVTLLARPGRLAEGARPAEGPGLPHLLRDVAGRRRDRRPGQGGRRALLEEPKDQPWGGRDFAWWTPTASRSRSRAACSAAASDPGRPEPRKARVRTRLKCPRAPDPGP